MGFFLESLSGVRAGWSAGISLIISFTIITLLNVFVLIPISSAEESLTFHDNDLRGRVGRVLTFRHILVLLDYKSYERTTMNERRELYFGDRHP